jgi:integrase
MAKSYPEGTKFGDWFVGRDADALTVRRMIYWPDGRRTAGRLPANKIKGKSQSELEALCDRLNHRANRRTITEIKTKLSFLPTELMEEFRVQLEAEIPNQKDAKLHYHNLHRYCLKFFIDIKGLKDPVEWKRNETAWGLALLGETKDLYNEVKAVKTIKGVIHTANRFLLFLHSKLPQEVPKIEFKPISKAKLKEHHARLNLDNEETLGLFIPLAHWRIIRKALPIELKPFVILAYYYGLRRAESLGLAMTDLREGHLSIQRQLKATEPLEFVPLKGRASRKTPHWFLPPRLTYKLLETTHPKIHPDTLGQKFGELMKKLGFPYKMHDLRRTFITRSLDHQTPKDVMLAVGHANIETTMRYVRDDRDLDDKPFVPRAG